ncbi:hypothetical protein KUTeg_012772 [Tegillarca granosa]|uniref:Uncharacterized protein n=1 Tax=Tegillarca granosa TaxID=220873 RepID=A0ABQ9F3T0_TEGGR|nr:hypothetical protein KUTeg_012772 [Tegillarca granosa]
MYPVRRYPSSVSSYTQPRVKVVRSPSDAASSPSVRRINVPKRSEPEATVKSVRANAPVDIKRTGPKYYRCTYVPPIPGAYLLDIKWNKRPLKCCPFKINVHNPVYPSRVDVTGDHLTGGGMVGKDLHINVDPRLAGTGKLTADCTGPTGQDVPVQLVENYDGTHKLKMKPVDEGRHVLEIRYNGEHVMGSPYAIDIGSDTTKGPVKLYGPGVEDGILPDYKSHFWVDARGAGAGEIHVSIMGPKGAFQVEMRRESQKDKLFHCSYSPHEPGLYTIVATWSGEHISNSPYKVCIAGSKDELERMVFERDNPLMPVDSFADQNTNTLTSGDSTKDQLMY